MRTPFFWYQPPGFLSTLLAPLGWLYGGGSAVVRAFDKPQKLPLPILSVGNIVCGGAGKTPVALAIASMLQDKGINVHFVTRGYGGTEHGPLKVEKSRHTPTEVGDEALLLAQQAPTWMAKNRREGVRRAAEDKADLVILDDGHQTRGLLKDLSFIIVDALQGFGNGHPIPAGPLRENLRAGLKRSDAWITIGDIREVPSPSFKASVIPQPMDLLTNRIVAFCGLGFPEKFYRALKELKMNLLATESFPDHYIYREEDLLRLEKLAQAHEAALVTTRKDWVKLNSSWQNKLHVLDINVQFQDPVRLCQFIFERIPSLKALFRKKDPESPSLRSRAQDDTTENIVDCLPRPDRVILRSPDRGEAQDLTYQAPSSTRRSNHEV